MPQYFNGDHWTPDTLLAWIGSLIDRACNITARADTGQLTFSVSARDPWVLHSVRDLYGAGDIERHGRIDGLHVWRVKQPDDIRRILTDVLPFLASKADEVRAVLARMDIVLERRAARERRNRIILATREEGRTHSEIADAVGASPQGVAQVIARWRKENDVTIRQRPRRHVTRS